MNPTLPPHPGRRAFTLIELIGTLAILALLTWVATETVFQRLKDTIRQEEVGRLARIADALRRGVIAERTIPAETNWVGLAARTLAVPSAEVGRNRAGWNRRLIYDPAFRVGSPPSLPPFEQTAIGSSSPVGARAVLLSTLAEDFPNLASVDFNELWDGPPDRLPSHWPGSWPGRPADLVIERISFLPFFRRVRLNNLDLDAPATFALGATNDRVVIPAGGRMETAFFVESPLLLIEAAGTIQEVLPVTEELSFGFEAGRWHRGLVSGIAHAQADLALQFDRFAALSETPWGGSAADVALVLNELLGGYCAWAEAGFPQTSGVTGRPAPTYRRLQEAVSQLGDATGLLLGLSPITP